MTLVIKNFWSKVKIPYNFKDGCWEWVGRVNINGYGYFSFRYIPAKTVSVYPHRLSYEYFYGSIPSGRVVRHKCGNKLCVSPYHLEVGTYSDNNNDWWLSVRGAKSLHRVLSKGVPRGSSRKSKKI